MLRSRLSYDNLPQRYRKEPIGPIQMIDGIYSITFRGAADWGIGTLVLHKGLITGADAAGVRYDGNYEERGLDIRVRMAMTVPPGAMLVQGTPAQSIEYTVPVDITLPMNALESGKPVLLELPHGPVNVIFQRLRTLSS